MVVQQALLSTRTGEPYQPARVYYQVSNQKTVIGAFQKLRCMDFDRERNRWVWLYEHEAAKKLRFTKPYNQIPKQFRPVIIGYFTFRGEEQMLLDLRSLERVIKAIDFFAKRINHRVAKATHVRVVNRYFSSQEMPQGNLVGEVPPSLDIFFDLQEVETARTSSIMAKVQQLSAESQDLVQDGSELESYLNELVNTPFPEIEEIPITYSDDGIGTLAVDLFVRQLMASRSGSVTKEYYISLF